MLFVLVVLFEYRGFAAGRGGLFQIVGGGGADGRQAGVRSESSGGQVHVEIARSTTGVREHLGGFHGIGRVLGAGRLDFRKLQYRAQLVVVHSQNFHWIQGSMALILPVQSFSVHDNARTVR